MRVVGLSAVVLARGHQGATDHAADALPVPAPQAERSRASQIFLHKNPAALTRREAALLAAVLPNPLELHIASPSPRVLQRRGWIEQQMTRLGGRRYSQQIGW